MSATVIKDFLVAIGFKSDSTGAKKMNDELVSVENRVKLLQQAFIGMATSIVGAVAKTSGELEKLYYSSQRIGASAGNIRAFQGAISQMGGSAEGAIQSMEALAQKIRQSPGMEKMVQGIGVATREANGDMRDQVEIFKDLGTQLSGMEYYRANAYGNALGVDEKTLMAIRDPATRQSIEKYQALQKSMGMNDDLAKSGKEFATEWRDLMMMSKALAEVIIMTAGKALIPVFKAINSGLQAAIKWFGKLDPGIKKFLATALKIGTLIVVFGGLFGAISKLARVLPILRGLLFLVRALSLAFFTSPIGIVLALAAAIALLWNDYQVWKEGGKSLIDWTLWQSGIDAAKEGITDLIKRMELLIKAGAALASRDFRLAKQLWDQATGGDPWEEKAPPAPPKPPAVTPASPAPPKPPVTPPSTAQTSSTTTAPSTMDNVLTAGKEAAKVVAGNVVDLAQKISLVGISSANAAVAGVVKNGDTAANEVKKGLGESVSSANKPYSTAMTEFKGGVIEGLTPEETLAFANRVMYRENRKGNLATVNKWGYTGKYQFGASALADTGFIDRDKFDKAPKGVKNGANAKAHRAFLEDKSNWIKGDWEQYKRSAEMQDESFRKLTETNLKYGKNIHKGNKAKMLGFAMAAHLKGAGNAEKWYVKRKDSGDGNGTRTSDYANFGEGALKWAEDYYQSPPTNNAVPTKPNALSQFAQNADMPNITSFSPPAKFLLPVGYTSGGSSKNVIINQSHKTDIIINGSESPQLTAGQIQRHEDNVNVQMARNARSILA